MLQRFGGLTARQFMRTHWQKRPLFVRAALPQFSGTPSEKQLVPLASRDDVESRMVERHAGGWRTTHGPFRRLSLPRRNATVLISGLNLHDPAADGLLRSFDFIAQARLDDVMLSYATPGGGVGPHVDSYDVFLIQGAGRRRWRIWFGGKVLTYEVQQGDLLYLPPGLRHDGVAIDACFTYSVGFRAPRGAELGAAFLDYLHERGLPEARYRDAGLEPSRSGARIPKELIAFSRTTLRRIRWTDADVVGFLGQYLTMPKSQVVFRASRSRRNLAASMVRLDLATQLLYSGSRYFLNGETVKVAPRSTGALRMLADRRCASGTALARAGLTALVRAWQRAGYLHFEPK